MPNPVSREDLTRALENIDSTAAKESLAKLIECYINPAFGSLPKREVDIALFQCLQELGIFNDTPDLYSLVSSLRITRAKARNLLYEVNLRKSTTENIEDELLELLKEPVFLKDNDKVCLEIGNPLLIDHLKHTLKDLKHITDGSFSPELVKLTPDAYIALVNEKFAKVKKADVDKALIECGAKDAVNAKTIFKGVLKKVGKKVADDAGDAAGELLGNYLGDLLSTTTETVTSFLSRYKDATGDAE
ncbi:MAG: hypothetical protein C0621_07980 [Desulfuromonas sp.]|nr:MAG: hypothetical protein C0621_07980 [Desulfuromonas sp.]